MSRRFWAAASVAVVGLVGPAGAWVGTRLDGEPRRPYCPSEDSCRPDYDGESNTWEIVEVTP